MYEREGFLGKQRFISWHCYGKITIFLNFWAFFGPFFAILSQNMRCFSPAFFYFQWLTVTSFHALIIHNIQWIAFFAKIFTKWGPFWVPWFFCICFYWDVCRKGFLRNNYLFHGINTEKWPYFWNLGLIWPILGIFLANSRYPKREMFFPCIIFHSITFTQQFSCFNLHNIQKNGIFGPNFH